MTDSVYTLPMLRRHIASLDGASASAQACARFVTGQEALDDALGGGLARARVHELFGASEDEAAVAGLALIFAGLAGSDAPLLWLRTIAAGRVGGLPYGPGLAALGIDPARLLVGVMNDDAMLLRAAVEALRCPSLGALVIELRGRAPLLDLTASRRLALAAEASGVTTLLLRIGGDPTPSAADTRWRVEAAPSAPLLGNAPGMSAFAVTLLRRRAGRDGMAWRLVWNSEKGVFGDGQHERDDLGRNGERIGDRPGNSAPLPGSVVPLPAAGPAADRAA